MPKLRLHHQHSWKVTLQDAREIQNQLAPLVCPENEPGWPCNYVAGFDLGFENNGQVARAAAVILSFPELEVVETAVIRQPTQFPYVTGYLSFREVPAALAALEKLKKQPDLILCDGQGIAHPRRFGLACHFGLLTDIPTIGVAKTRLVGTHDEVPAEKGAWRPLLHRDECIGVVLRTRRAVKPVYVSIGHKISLDTAISRVLDCTTRYRLPETTRHAHHLASVADR